MQEKQLTNYCYPTNTKKQFPPSAHFYSGLQSLSKRTYILKAEKDMQILQYELIK